MGDKSERKQKYIVEKAREVFANKGYKNVSMKDIVDACDISRGGLYIYFGSTKELFLEVLKLDNTDEDIFAGKITEKSTAAEILVVFLVEQKKEILKRSGSLTKAIYEFYFEDRPDKKDDFLKDEFDGALEVITKVIEMGSAKGEFSCNNSVEAAKNIMYTLEGLKICANTIGISSESIDRQFLYILSTLGVEDDENEK